MVCRVKSVSTEVATMAAICHGLRLKPQNRMPKVRKVSCKPSTAQRGSWRGGIGRRRMVVNGMRMEGGSLKIGMGAGLGKGGFYTMG